MEQISDRQNFKVLNEPAALCPQWIVCIRSEVMKKTPSSLQHSNKSNFGHVYFFLLNNQPDALIIQIYSVIKLYMLRASSLHQKPAWNLAVPNIQQKIPDDM
jgi:hypothetical protein